MRAGRSVTIAIACGRPMRLRALERRLDQAVRHVVGGERIDRAGLQQIGGRDVAGMRAAAHDVGRAGDHLHAGCLCRPRRCHRHRELADADAVGGVLRDLLLGAVVVAGQRDVAAGDAIEQRAAVRDARPLALRLQFAGCGVRCSRRPARRGGAVRDRNRDRRTGRRRGCGPSG